MRVQDFFAVTLTVTAVAIATSLIKPSLSLTAGPPHSQHSGREDKGVPWKAEEDRLRPGNPQGFTGETVNGRQAASLCHM